MPVLQNNPKFEPSRASTPTHVYDLRNRDFRKKPPLGVFENNQSKIRHSEKSQSTETTVRRVYDLTESRTRDEYRARYYSTELGQFISRDPLEFVDGMNMYSGYFARQFAMDPNGQGLLSWLNGFGWSGELADEFDSAYADALSNNFSQMQDKVVSAFSKAKSIAVKFYKSLVDLSVATMEELAVELLKKSYDNKASYSHVVRKELGASGDAKVYGEVAFQVGYNSSTKESTLKGTMGVSGRIKRMIYPYGVPLGIILGSKGSGSLKAYKHNCKGFTKGKAAVNITAGIGIRLGDSIKLAKKLKGELFIEGGGKGSVGWSTAEGYNTDLGWYGRAVAGVTAGDWNKRAIGTIGQGGDVTW